QLGPGLAATRRRPPALVRVARARPGAGRAPACRRLCDRLRRAAELLPVRAHRQVPALESAGRPRAGVRRLTILAGVAACTLALADAASPTIEVGRGIAGARLGMSQAAVRARLGRPVTVVHGTNEFGSYTELRYRGYVVVLQGNTRATSIVT